MIHHIEEPKDSVKRLLEPKRKFGRFAGYEVNERKASFSSKTLIGLCPTLSSQSSKGLRSTAATLVAQHQVERRVGWLQVLILFEMQEDLAMHFGRIHMLFAEMPWLLNACLSPCPWGDTIRDSSMHSQWTQQGMSSDPWMWFDCLGYLEIEKKEGQFFLGNWEAVTFPITVLQHVKTCWLCKKDSPGENSRQPKGPRLSWPVWGDSYWEPSDGSS